MEENQIDRTKTNKAQKASLGCGTLILIALIVLIFSKGDGEFKNEIIALRAEVINLTDKVARLEDKIGRLTQTLEQKNH